MQRAVRSAILGAARPSSAPAWMELGVWENRWLSPSPSVPPTAAAGRRSEQPILPSCVFFNRQCHSFSCDIYIYICIYTDVYINTYRYILVKWFLFQVYRLENDKSSDR